jgi:hypothetical protein
MAVAQNGAKAREIFTLSLAIAVLQRPIVPPTIVSE